MLSLFRWIWRGLKALFGAAPPARKSIARKSEPARKREPARIRVEYRPSIDGDPDPGEVVWTWVTFEDDPSQGKDRPVLLVGYLGNSLVGVALTSKHHARAAQMDVGQGPWDAQRRTSYVKLDRLIEVDPARVRREGAVMPRARFDRVIEALRALHPDRFAR
jgi:hypothetical protein